MTATFWSNFSKRNNSTKQPSGSGTAYTVYLKDNVSVLAPVFRIEGIDLTVTYCQWNGRYYFVRDIVLSNNAIYEVHCEIDPMATWKSAIGSSSQYVLRSASQSDGRIVDMFYPSKKQIITRQEYVSPLPTWTYNVNSGYYVVGIVSGSATQSGAASMGTVQYYAFSPSAFNAFSQNIFTDANWTNFQTADRYSFNPIQYIASVLWFPTQPPVSGQVLQGIKVGWELIGCTALVMTSLVDFLSYTVTPDDHPQASSRGSYLNAPPYSEYRLSFPPFGDIDIDGSLFSDRTTKTIGIHQRIDYVTGRSVLEVSIATSTGYTGTYILGRRECQFGVSIQLSQIAADRLGLVNDTIGTISGVVGNMLTGNPVGAITGAISGIISGYQTAQPRVSSSGINDSMTSFTLGSHQLNEIYHYIVDEDNADCGRPLCQTKTISSLSGYILCANAEISIAGLPSERDQIVAYMDGGFFYE